MRKALAAALCLVLLAMTGAALAETTVTITFVGDCTLGGEDWLVNREGSFHDYAREKGYTYFFEEMRDFFAEELFDLIRLLEKLLNHARDRARLRRRGAHAQQSGREHKAQQQRQHSFFHMVPPSEMDTPVTMSTRPVYRTRPAFATGRARMGAKKCTICLRKCNKM